MTSSFQPFPIAEFKSGIVTYNEPWVRPKDAFEPLINAYVYRGSIYKRGGTSLLGRMKYCNNQIISTAAILAGGTVTGTLSSFPIDDVPSTFSIKVLTNIAVRTYVVDVDGSTATLKDGGTGVGSITWATGAWSITLRAAETKGANVPIVAHYEYTPQAKATPPNLPIMGIKQYINETTNVKKLVVIDTKRAAVFDPGANDFDCIDSVSQVIWVGLTGITTQTTTTSWVNLAPYSVSVSDGTTTITDTPVNSTTGNLSSGGNFAAGGTVNYTTGTIMINLTAPSVGTTYTASFLLQGDYFTGDYTQFFNSTNWINDLYLVNNKDPITLYDGTNLSRPAFGITVADRDNFVNDIVTALDVKVYKNRLQILRPTTLINGVSTIEPQTIRFSAVQNATNIAADIAGNGGFLEAPTGDWLMASQFLRDYMVVFFENSTWIYRFTSNQADPFRFDSINSSKATNAPYGSIGYDERLTSMGNRGLIATDGVNVQRYDIPIVDFFDTIDDNAFNQCFGARFDELNQSYMLYPSNENDQPSLGFSNNILVYNFVEDTWATFNIYTNNLAAKNLHQLSCLGQALNTQDATWQDFAPGGVYFDEAPGGWVDADWPWNRFRTEGLAPIMLLGDEYGNVLILNDNVVTDEVWDPVNFAFSLNTIEATIKSTRLNPFVMEGTQVEFGYIDIYYQVNPNCEFTVNFYLGNTTNVSFSRTLTLDTKKPNIQTYEWKRIYMNCVGEFVQIELISNSLSNFKIVGMVLWARPAGRLTP